MRDRLALVGPITTLLLVAAAVSAPRAGAAQTDSAVVTPGPRYEARGALHARLLGRKYRDLWTTPVEVEVLDLARFAGGLVPVEAGGSLQTVSLRLRGADGREYNFRSVDKDVTRGLPPYARETLVDWLGQDQISAQLPAAPLVATGILDAAGILNPGPRLVVMPDDPRLGPFRERFAGMLGTLEVHPNEGEDDEPLFHGAARVAGTDRLLEHLEEDLDHRLDARAFLAARLVDVLIGDWDRHVGQWRWARYDRDGLHWWVPVPEDRDYAFVHHDGQLLSLAREALPRLIRFEERYPPLLAMMANSVELNRRLLAGLSREAWDSVAADLQARITDPVIAAAVRRMPPAHYEREGAALEGALRARRDRLREMAAEYYRLMADNVEIHATDHADRAEIVHARDGTLHVRVISGIGGEDEATRYERVFRPGETREVRVYLHGGDDRAVVRGGGGQIVVRVMGGGGDDLLEDRSLGRTAFYDDRGENRFLEGPRTSVSRESYQPPPAESGLLPRGPTRDWGASRSAFSVYLDWRSHAELVVGGGPSWKRYAFRHHPFATQVQLRGLYAPLHTRFGAELVGEFHGESSRRHVELLARASQLEAVRFHGFGNQVPDQGKDRVRVWMDQFLVRSLLHVPISTVGSVALGARAEHLTPRPEVDSPLARLDPYGSEPFGQLGAEALLELDARDDEVFPRSGFQLELEGAAYPPLWDVSSAYARGELAASAYASLPLPLDPVLAMRAGGAGLLGPFPFHQAAFLGGSRNLRGTHGQRFAGDAMLFGGAELRVPLAPVELLLHGTLGASLLADAGRVFVQGDSPGGWHTAVGGSLWFVTPVAGVSLSYVRGEENRLSAKLGMPF